MLHGRTALVTGSTSGIGLGIATALAGAGARVVFTGRKPSPEVEAALAALGAERARLVLADLATAEGVGRLVAAAEALFGPADILVNNAGIQYVAPLEAFPPERWDAIIATNLSAAFHATRLVLGGMKARGWGRIVNVASAHALVASPFKAAYVAAKHGLLGLTKVTALEGAEQGVTANALCPGYVRTPLVDQQIADQAKAHGIPEDAVVRTVMLAMQPTRRFVTVEDLGALTVFLCGDSGAGITGAALPVDGGWTAR